jgi:NAD(P)H dehydrogenase (quinone)
MTPSNEQETTMSFFQSGTTRRDTRVAVIYYSSTGGTHAVANAIAEGAEKAGAEVRVRRVPELAPDEAINSNEAWAAHVRDTAHVAVASHEDLLWADAIVLGSPTRFGLPSSQLKQFIDTTGGLWQQGLLANKVYASFTSTATAHGGVEATILALNNTFYHWGGIIVPPGYTAEVQFAHGNPYGASHMAGVGAPSETTLRSAVHLGDRVVSVATVTQELREAS